MITVPAIQILPNAKHYRDSDDPQLVYLDILAPSPVHGESALRWLPLPDRTAYLVGEVQFGAGQKSFDLQSTEMPGQRRLPVPWEPATVYTWYRQGEASQMVAKGRTSGYGAANAVLNGTAPLSAMAAEVQISADLYCRARLIGSSVRGGGDIEAIQQAFPRLKLGSLAGWDITLAEVLTTLLAELLASGSLSLRFETGSFDVPAQAELEELALLEWAKRLIGVEGIDLTLASPASQITALRLPEGLSLDLYWQAGGIVPLRAVRTLHNYAR